MASDNPFVFQSSNSVYSENPFPPPKSIFSNINSKETLTDSKPKQNSDTKETLTDSKPKQNSDFKKLKESNSLPDLSNHEPPYYNSSYIAEFSRHYYGSDRDRARVYQNLEEKIEERRRLDHLAAMWPVISANTKFFCIDDVGNGIAVQIAEANKAFAAAIKAVAAANEAANKVAAYAASTAATAPRFQYFAVKIAKANKAFAAANEAANKVAAYAASTAARMEQLKLETKAPLDSPSQFGFCGSVNKDPAVIELENKILSDNARKALEHYKETNDEEYEFVENEKFESTILPPFMAAHITFKAKPKEKADSCPKLFFAEIYNKLFIGEPDDYEPDDFEVKMCMILDSCGPDVKMGCDYVLGDKDMLHPRGVKFWTGAPSCTREWDECEYPAIIELENKISSEPSCVNEDLEIENKIFSKKARKALEHYNETNDEEYEFVEIENFETNILHPFIASHITFKAKPKEKADSCPKLFFAEIYEGYESDDFEVKMCMILDYCGPDVKMGCDNFQGKDMLHPSGVKFWTGAPSCTREWDECEYPAIIELENKISSEPSCVNEYLEIENKIFSKKARKALEHYNETNDEEYEFVEIENFETNILHPFIASHITFKAKPKEKADSCPKLFFAEIYEGYESDDFEVKMCMILDNCGPDVKMGCDNFQGKDMLHPSGVKFWTGAPSCTREWDECEYPAIIELENKISSEPSCVNEDLEIENKIFSKKARKALEHYNETNDEEYEFVEIENFETNILHPFIASHITFKAKPKEKADSCPKLFFAEIYEGYESDDFEVKMCMILDNCGPDVKMGCDNFQGKDMLHPSGVKFWTGAPSCTREWDECEYPAIIELENKISSEPSCVNEDLEIENKIFSKKARKALEHYNETNDEEYEFVEIENFETNILHPFIASHITFKAKPKEKADSCPKLFFAEIYEGYESDDFEVKMCMILDYCGPDVKMGCDNFQGKDMLHPSGVKFWTGPPGWDKCKARNSSSRT